MKMKTLSYLLIPVLGLGATISMAAPQFPTGSMTVNITNNTACKLVADRSVQSPCAGMPTVKPGKAGTFTCNVGSSLYLYYNPAQNAGMAHDSSLLFHHNVVSGTSGYSYFMQSYGTNNVAYTVSAGAGSTTLQGANSEILSDDGQGNPNIIKSTAINVVVSGGPTACTVPNKSS